MAYNDRIDAFWSIIHGAQHTEFKRSRAVDIANSITPDTAQRISETTRAYPHMSPGVVRALASSGYDPDNPASVYAAYMDAAQQTESPQGFGRSYGDAIDFTGFSGRAMRFALSQQDPRVSGALQGMGYGEGSPRIEAGQAAEAHRLGGAPTVYEQLTGRGTYNARRLQERQVMNQMGYGEKSFDSMSTEELIPLLASVQMLQGPGGGQKFGEENAKRLLEEDRNQAIELLNRKLGPQQDRSILSRSPADIIGGAISTPAAATDRELASIPGVAGAYSGVKAASRVAFAAAQYPIQEFQSIVRNAYGMATGEIDPFAPAKTEEAYVNIGEATDIGIIAEKALAGEKVDTGQGFFIDPDSEVARLRREREVLSGTIGGHAPTLGRIFADTFTEPDTEPFNFISGTVDAGVTWYADPMAIIPYGQITRARKTFQIGQLDEAYEAAGMVNGVRRYTNPQVFRDWATTDPRARAAITHFTDLKSPYDIDKYTNFAIGPQAANRLARSNTERTVINTMDSLVNKGKVRTTTEFTGTRPYRMRYSYGQARQSLNPNWRGYNRLTQRLPGAFVNIQDKTQTAEQIRRVLTNVNAPEDLIRKSYNQVASATTPSGILKGAQMAMDDVGGVLEAYGYADEGLRRSLATLRDTRNQTDIRGLIEGIGSDTPNPMAIIVNGQPIPIADTHHSLQTLSQYWEIGGDMRDLRRRTSSLRFLTEMDNLKPITRTLSQKNGVLVKSSAGNVRLPFSMMEHLAGTMSKGIRGANDLGDQAMTLLKASWLLRPAWPVRFLSEEQIRIANSPLDTASFFDHPAKVLAIQMGKTHHIDPSGNMIDQLQEFTYAQVHGHGGWVRDQRAIPRGQIHVFAKSNPEHTKDFDYNWANSLAHHAQHPVVNHLLNNSRDDTLNWLLKGKGRKFLREQRDTYGGLTNRNQVNSWLDTITDNVRHLTNNDTDLLNAVRNSNYQGVPIYLNDASINLGFRRIMAAHHDINAPQYMNGVKFTTTKQDYNSVMDHIWGMLFSKPANYFSREPFFKQALWRNTQELVGGATKTAQKNILANARKAGIKGEEYRRLELAASRAHGRLSADDISELAKGYALDDTKQLLYDLTERRQWADVARILVPFGDAYQEIIQSWSRLITQQRGKPLYRLGEIVEAARSPGTGETLGTGVEGGGFFWEDEHQTEMFNYPGSQFVTQMLTGVPTPLSARVQGLNMVGNFVPGLGPVVQIPAAYFIDKYKDLEVWRDLLVPFGAPGSGETSWKDPFNYGPAWIRKALQSFNGAQNQRLYNNQIMAAYSYLISTGEYGHTPEDLQAAMEKATDSVNGANGRPGIFGITAWGAFILPASPTPRELIEDKDGNLLSAAAISKDYWEMVDDKSYEEANGWYLSNFGEDAIGAIVPKSATIAKGIPRTIAQGEWWKAHPDLASQFTQTYGLFGPQGGEFDYTVYIESILSGQREMLSPQEFLKVMNDWMGNYWYGRVREDTGGDNPTDEQRSIRTEAAAQIEADYPYWDRQPGMAGLPRPAETDQLIKELQRGLTHPELRSTEVGQALTFYFDAREQADKERLAYNEEWGTEYKSFAEADDLAYIREWLREVANRIIKDYPAFENTWDSVLNRELSEDTFLRQ